MYPAIASSQATAGNSTFGSSQASVLPPQANEEEELVTQAREEHQNGANVESRVLPPMPPRTL